jgi:hypothetical protein
MCDKWEAECCNTRECVGVVGSRAFLLVMPGPPLRVCAYGFVPALRYALLLLVVWCW